MDGNNETIYGNNTILEVDLELCTTASFNTTAATGI